MSSISESTEPGSSRALLSVRGLGQERGGRQLFSGLNFDLEPGELLRVGGENGAGKTSLLRILSGISRYGFSGKVCSDGFAITDPRAGYAARTLYLGHHAAVKLLLSPRENLAWHVNGESRHNNAVIEQALGKVGLFGYEDEPSHNLSAGQQRRVNLARLYLSRRPLWLLDEPFTAIDRSGVKQLEAHLAAHVNAGGAVILTSHQALQVGCPIRTLNLSTGGIT